MSEITQVTADIYRGPRPQPNQFADIRAKFKTVISLEGQEEDNKEIKELAPVVVLSQPITFWQMYSPWHAIPVSRLIYLLELVNGVPKPVLVHCQHGQDRTGLVIAAYRVRIMGWSKDQSMNEALAFGYRNWLNYGLNKTWEELTP